LVLLLGLKLLVLNIKNRERLKKELKTTPYFQKNLNIFSLPALDSPPPREKVRELNGSLIFLSSLISIASSPSQIRFEHPRPIA